MTNRGASGEPRTGGEQMTSAEVQGRANTRMWGARSRARAYTTTDLAAGEAAVLERFADDFGGRVLEIGCGTGRVTGHMAALSTDVRAVDISPQMLDRARPLYPAVAFARADLRELSGFPDADCDVIALWDNLIDIVGDEERATTLSELARMLRPGGLLVLDTHNLAHAPQRRRATDLTWDSPAAFVRAAAAAPVKLFNHRRLVRHEQSGEGYAVLNDEAHRFMALHYYVDRGEQERQLGVAGLELVAIVDRSGTTLGLGDRAPRSPSLTYVARRPG